MVTLLLTIGLIGLTMLSMAVGVALSGRSLRGSCGGAGGNACFCESPGDKPCQRRSN